MRIFVLGFCTALLSCAATTAPRFEQDLATTFARDDMHRLQTPELELYYPAEYADAAKRVGARASECLVELRKHGLRQPTSERALLFLTSANFNNAYVGGYTQGEPLHSAIPLSFTSEIFHWYGLGGAEAGDVACHEMFHYVHFEQTFGFWNFINTVFGRIFPPQAFTERWFTEGVAQYYEGRIRRTLGRPHSPLYRGAFDSFVAAREGRLGPGDLSLSQRELIPFSGAYLTGLHFIEWLVETYGEERLWELMDLQGRSFFSPFGVTLRFKTIYGLSLGALVDTWEEHLRASLIVRKRPAEEQSLHADVGQLARLAAHAASGVVAVISSGNEQVPLLRILEADGRVRIERRLIQLGTDREHVFAGPGSMSGLSFTSDGRFLFLLNDDLIERGDTRAQIWKIDAATGETLKIFQDIGRGMGGSISPDGASFTYVDFPAGKSRLIERHLESQEQRIIAEFPSGVTVSSPQWNEAHTHIVYSRHDGNGWNLILRTSDGQERLLTDDGAFNYGAKWIDDTHLLFVRTAGQYLQAHRMDIVSQDIERLTDTPYGLIDVAPRGKDVVALVRDGTRWTVDTMPWDAKETLSGHAPQAPAPQWESPKLHVEEDTTYSAFDHLMVPQLRVPGGSVFTTTNASGDTRLGASVSLSLMGRDRLGKHSWLLEGSYAFPTSENIARAEYANRTLAPWTLSIGGERRGFVKEAYWTGALTASRTVFTVPVAFGIQAEVWQPIEAKTQQFIGPSVSLAYSAGDGTAYAGAQRAFRFSLDAAAYPKFIGSTRDMVDLRAAVSLSLPLPLSKRHSFLLNATGRSLPGAPEDALRVGGVSSFVTLYSNGSQGTQPTTSRFLPGNLVEALRGYDDYAIRAQHVGIVNARYRYSFIIDRGFASFLYLLPSLFFRQVDVEGFGAAAFTEANMARSAGASVSLRTEWGSLLPVSLTYQFAWRFDHSLPPLHVVGLSFE